MDLEVRRFEFSAQSTIGGFLIGGGFFCWSLEDPSRDGPKVMGETCIPVGTYTVVLDWSNRFQKQMPHILDVPGFSGIRIHPGNDAADTSGCVLLGFQRAQDQIWDSRLAFDLFMEKFTKAVTDGEKVTIRIAEGIL